MGNDLRIAILMTCHNRRELTLKCLEILARDAAFSASNLFLVDDGSSDGTGDAVRAAYPDANVITGDGSLFWNGGMRLAWDAAMASDRGFTHYFWLNDDVELHPGALSDLADEALALAPVDGAIIVTGAMVHPDTGAITYSGQVSPNAFKPLHFEIVAPSGKPQRVRTMSGNAVLVSEPAARRLGNLDPTFRHIFGDLDYGLRAVADGIPVYLASKVAGACADNSASSGKKQQDTGRWARVRATTASWGSIHQVDWYRLVRLHSGLGPFSGVYRLAPMVRAFLDKPKAHARRFPATS